MKLQKPVVLIAATLLISACAAPISQTAKKSLAKNVDCSTARQDLETLKREKASLGKEVVDGIRTVLPVSAMVEIMRETWKDRATVGVGEYNEAIDAKIYEIKSACGEKFASTDARGPLEQEGYQERMGGRLSSNSADAKLINRASYVLKTTTGIWESAIPPALLRNAYGIAVFPRLQKFGIIVGGRHGTGIVMVRGPKGEWGNPYKASFSGVGMGFQFGYQQTDVILVFKTRQSIDGLLSGKYTLGADASIAIGPAGRKVEAATDIKLASEIYSYSRSRGLFAGVSLEGAGIEVENELHAPSKVAALKRLLNKHGRLSQVRLGR
jgi:lipid-binding SYLF domain-containing protein